MTNYKTVSGEGVGEFTDRKSRFIASVKNVISEDEALDFLNTVKQNNRLARHNAYAYILRDKNIMRYSDDGEPGGTAGVPVLEILKNEGLTDIIVVVTRYFGGILLGTGGLVHAYSAAAKAGLEDAKIAEITLCKKLSVICPYNISGKVQYETENFNNAFIKSTDYGQDVKFNVYVTDGSVHEYTKRIIDKTNAGVNIEEYGEEYINKNEQ